MVVFGILLKAGLSDSVRQCQAVPGRAYAACQAVPGRTDAAWTARQCQTVPGRVDAAWTAGQCQAKPTLLELLGNSNTPRLKLLNQME